MFIDRAVAVHGDKYDYSEVSYVRNRDKVKIKCKVHDTFFYQTPKNHTVQGNGCPIWGLESRVAKMYRISLEDFIRRGNEIHNGKYDYSITEAFENTTSKVSILCPLHGAFKQSVNGHLTGAGCKECAKMSVSQTKTHTQEQFIAKCIKRHGDKYDYSKAEYTGAKEKVLIRCKVHNHNFMQEANSHCSGSGCPLCQNEISGQYHRLLLSDFITRSTEVHEGVYDYSLVTQFKNSHDKVPILCSEHGVFHQSVANHMHGENGCPSCANYTGGGYSQCSPAYFYINLVGDNAALKVGITNFCPVKRSKILNRGSSLPIKNLYYFYHEDGKFIRDLEMIILRKFETGIISKEVMRDGFTETLSVEHLPEIIDIVVYQFNNYLKPQGCSV